MSDQQRNVWAQLSQGDSFQKQQQQYPVPDGYAPVHGYAPVQGYAPSEAQNGSSNYQESSAGYYGTHQTQSDNTHTVDGDDDNDDEDTSEEDIREFMSSRRQQRKSKSQAVPKKDQPKSKRAELREKIANENHGEVSATDQPKGLVEWREGIFQWWDPTNSEWLNAAYHDKYRDQFMVEDATIGSYIVAPSRGIGNNDITSACSAYNQLNWRLADRDSWGTIVDGDGNKVLYLIDRPVQSYEIPERLWFHDGCVLLDGDNNPVRPFPGIPRCFSSKIEGSRIEVLRRIIPGLTIQDFRARMLREVPTGAGIGAPTKPLSYPSTFGHRSSRFRSTYQTPAWLPRAASAVLKKQVTDLLPEAEDATTTEGLQPLSRYEIARRKSSTRGKFLYKANGRAISDTEREKRDRKILERLERQAASQPSTPQRLQSVPKSPLQSASPSPYLPTPPYSSGIKRLRNEDESGDDGVGQSEPAAKRGRLGPSPRLQGRFPTPQTSPEDPFQQVPTTYDPTSGFSIMDSHQGFSSSNATGLGLDFGGGKSVIPETLAPSEEAVVTESPLDATASTNASQNENNLQVDYRFVEPQNSREKLSIQAALFYPRTHYRYLMGEYPPHTAEGSYSFQYLQVLTLLEQNWMEHGGPPALADVGIWYGSFSTVPTPDLPDRVVEILCIRIATEG